MNNSDIEKFAIITLIISLMIFLMCVDIQQRNSVDDFQRFEKSHYRSIYTEKTDDKSSNDDLGPWNYTIIVPVVE